MPHKTIYISDQNEHDRTETQRLLQSHGYLVSIWPTGEEALAAAHETPPDLFMTAMGLKGQIDGLQLVRQLKADEQLKDIPVILHSAVQRIMNLPFRFAPDPKWFPVFDAIEKPARPDYLLDVVKRAIESRTPTAA